MGLLELCCGGGLAAAVAQRRASLTAAFAGLGPLQSWRPPGPPGVAPGADGEGLVELANRLVAMGCPDFDLNVEVLQGVGGDLDAAAAILTPA